MSHLLTSLDNFPTHLQGGAVSVGNFDGVHLGHAGLVDQLVAAARKHAGPAIVLTFDPPPAALLFPDRPLSAPLTTIAHRAELLFDLGVDALVAYPTDQRLLSLSAETFFQECIVGRMRAKAMVEGPNFRFGRDRSGDVDRLKKLCNSAKVDFTIAQASQDQRGLISSTRIRELLIAGELAAANSMLTQPYRFCGLVVQGARRGRELGFPTANLAQIESLLPGHGVYAGQAVVTGPTTDDLDQPVSWLAAINIGPNPTFGESRSKVEVHLIDYSGPELYGRNMRVTLKKKVRDVRKFESLDALRLQISRDLQECTAYL